MNEFTHIAAKSSTFIAGFGLLALDSMPTINHWMKRTVLLVFIGETIRLTVRYGQIFFVFFNYISRSSKF